MSSKTAVEKPEFTVANPDVVTKYKTGGDIAKKVLGELKTLAVPGANIIELCNKGDELLAAGAAKVYNSKKGLSKGIAFPTSVSVDDCVAYYSPIEGDAVKTLEAGQTAKICVGVHIDGYASILSDTIAVGGQEFSPEVKNAVAAAHYATEAALRTVKPGSRNMDVTRVVDLVTKEFGVTGMEGMLSLQHQQNNIAGKKRIIINPSESQRRDFESQKFEENEVYGLDIIVSTEGSSGKTKSKQDPTNVFRKTDLTYQLKLRSSRLAITDVQKKAGPFPFSVKILDDQRRVRMALKEPLDHGLVEGYDVLYEKEGKTVVQYFTTFALTKNGIIKLAAADAPNLEGTKKIENEELNALLKTSLKVNKNKK